MWLGLAVRERDRGGSDRWKSLCVAATATSTMNGRTAMASDGLIDAGDSTAHLDARHALAHGIPASQDEGRLTSLAGAKAFGPWPCHIHERTSIFSAWPAAIKQYVVRCSTVLLQPLHEPN